MGLVVGTAGHIDHGKTTLVRALTGIDTDRLKEEKRRALSIDLGFAHMGLDDGGVVSFVDVPGHERFIRNMLAGVGGIDCVLFCVACDDGVMPQTIEHLEIVNTLGIEEGLFVLTKADLVDRDRLEEVKRDVQELTRDTTLEGAPVVVVSVHRGTGLEDVVAHIKTLYAQARKRRADRWIRLPVDRVFPVKGFGCVVTGTLIDGSMKKGQTLTLFPHGQVVRVRGLQTHHKKLSVAEPHSRVAVNLSGISHRETRRGDMLMEPTLYENMKGATIFDCIIDVSRFAGRPLKNNTYLKLHCFTTEATVRIRLVDREELSPGMNGVARVFGKAPLPLLGTDRFILRDPSMGRTSGGGRVVVTYPSRRLITHLKDMDTDGLRRRDVRRIAEFLLKRRVDGIGVDTLAFMLNVEEERVLEACGAGRIQLVGRRLVSAHVAKRLREQILSTLEEYHGRYPERRGMHQDELGERADVPGCLKEAFFNLLVEQGSIRTEGALVRLSCHSATLRGRDGEIARWLLSTIEDGVCAIREDTMTDSPYRKDEVERVLHYLRDSGRLVRLKEGLYMARDTIDMAMDRLKCYIKKNGGIRAAEFRDLMGCGRRLAIEMLEYFDRKGVTTREGDVRRLLNP